MRHNVFAMWRCTRCQELMVTAGGGDNGGYWLPRWWPGDDQSRGGAGAPPARRSWVFGHVKGQL